MIMAAAAAATSIVNSAISRSPLIPLPPATPPPQLIHLPVTTSSSSPLTVTLSQSVTATQPLLPVLPKHTLSDDLVSVLWPCVPYSNTFFFKSGYNVQVTVEEDEPEEQLIGRFRREVFRAGVIQEIKRRKCFESTQDKRKRKFRDAARRNRKRRFPPKAVEEDDKTASQKEDDDDDEDDNWEFIDTELPYCHSR